MNTGWRRWREAEDMDANPRRRSNLRSKSVGDGAIFTDAMFNFVPGSAFETGTSLAILDNPGVAGKFLDNLAKDLSTIITLVYESPLGDLQIAAHPHGLNNVATLKNYFNRKLFNVLQPNSDQIGRCRNLDLSPNWMNEQQQGKKWLQEQLQIDSDSEEYDFSNMLTKVRSLNVWGEMVLAIMTPYKLDTAPMVIEAAERSKKIFSKLLNKPIAVIEERMLQIHANVHHKEFNEKKTRGRTEKIPKLFGQNLTDIPGITARTIDGKQVRVGFGQVFHASAMEGDPRIIEEHERLVKIGRQAMPRLGQDISDMSAPGLLGNSAQPLIPSPFIEIGLQETMAAHRFEHGSGLNRWQLTGTYPIQSWDHNFPAAGAQSATTTSFFISANCLSETTLFGNPLALHAGLIIASFMNFGGYHSFIETFPIAQAIARDAKFLTQVTKAQRNLYAEMERTVAANGSDRAAHLVHQYFQVYKATMSQIQKAASETRDVKFFRPIPKEEECQGEVESLAQALSS